jgi:mono/diheme cytochrome c family protein
MNRTSIVLTAAVALAAASALAAEPAAKGSPKTGSSPAQITRGKYLVEKVAMCGDCHSPRDQQGQFIGAKWLHGAPLDFKNIVPMPRWAELAPPLAGLPGWSAEQAVNLLMTGKDPHGDAPEPPMPAYRMSREDATAVVSYLKSLPPPGAN